MLRLSNWHVWHYEMGIVGHKLGPFAVLRHGNWPGAEFGDCVFRVGAVFGENGGKDGYGLLDLANNNGFEFASGCLEVEICLYCQRYAMDSR
jgi:hypothetical protein